MSPNTVQLKKDVEKDLNFRNFLNVYNFETEISSSKEVVKFKPITTGQLKKMLIYENADMIGIEEALDELIVSSITSPEFDINKIYVQDRFDLLIDIKRKSQGADYQYKYDCSSCKSQSLQTISLNNLDFIEFDKSDEVIEINKDISVKVGHITRGEQKEAYKHANLKNKSDIGKQVEMGLINTAATIKEIILKKELQPTTFKDKIWLVDNIDTGTYKKIESWHEDNKYGTQFSHEVKCIQCGKTESMIIPFDNFFL